MESSLRALMITDMKLLQTFKIVEPPDLGPPMRKFHQGGSDRLTRLFEKSSRTRSWPNEE